jgi:hypothetical protein
VVHSGCDGVVCPGWDWDGGDGGGGADGGGGGGGGGCHDGGWGDPCFEIEIEIDFRFRRFNGGSNTGNSPIR